jgi:hypothetical protein
MAGLLLFVFALTVGLVLGLTVSPWFFFVLLIALLPIAATILPE